MTRFLIVFAALFSLMGAQSGLAQSGLPDSVSPYVNDFADLLSPDQKAALETQLRDGRKARDVEMTVVIIERMDDYARLPNIRAFATQLFNKWGVGDAARNDGIMMLVALEDRKTRIALGKGYPERFDKTAQGIIDDQMLPSFRQGNFAEGIQRGTRASLRLLDINAVPPIDTRGWFVRMMEDSVPFQMLIILGGMVTLPLSPFLIILGVQKYRKHRKRRCPECGRKMRKLGEVQEDQYLDAGQRLEERLQSSDYGVWICEYDEHITVQRYSLSNKNHGACPNCKYHTLETKRRKLAAATYSTTGQVELTDTCANCQHKAIRTVDTPMLQLQSDDNSSSSFSSSSSRSSSSFGGGSSSGGGASGSW